MSLHNRKNSIITLIVSVTLISLSYSKLANAIEASATQSLMRPGHVMPATRNLEVWAQADIFDKSFDITNYAQKLGTSAKPDSFYMGKLGINYRINPEWTIRSEVMYGSQTIVRTLEPKKFSPNFHSQKLLVQWNPDDYPFVVEGGIINYGVLTEGFSIYEQANLTVTAAPGKDLVSSAAKSISIMTGISFPLIDDYDLSLRLGGELYATKVQARYAASDPFVQSILAPQAPQNNPWHEYQGLLFVTLDYKLLPSLSVGMDLKHLKIQRDKYIPRAGFRDYNSAQILDAWLFWRMSDKLGLSMRGHANTNYLLGEAPAFYNRRINHKFKHPFGYITAALVFNL